MEDHHDGRLLLVTSSTDSRALTEWEQENISQWVIELDGLNLDLPS